MLPVMRGRGGHPIRGGAQAPVTPAVKAAYHVMLTTAVLNTESGSAGVQLVLLIWWSAPWVRRCGKADEPSRPSGSGDAARPTSQLTQRVRRAQESS